MSDLIRKQDAIDALKEYEVVESDNFTKTDPITMMTVGTIADCIEAIVDLPSAEPERTVNVKRVPYAEEINYDSDGECKCGKWVDVLWSYCPHCGAKLDWSE